MKVQISLSVLAQSDQCLIGGGGVMPTVNNEGADQP